MGIKSDNSQQQTLNFTTSLRAYPKIPLAQGLFLKISNGTAGSGFQTGHHYRHVSDVRMFEISASYLLLAHVW
ncbi:MAG: hypothetical protein IPM82_10360 [Saprospiraceae bacterium]|nr:hypothetical protein [Saprospiraceae bacterium]